MPEPAEPDHTSRSSPWLAFFRGAANALICLLAAGLVALAIGRVLPFPNVTLVKQKYEYYAAHRDEFDLIFVGSSRFYHQVIPPEFDRLVEQTTGQRIHSFNTASNGSWPPESYYFLRQLLALKPRRLKWVVIDAMEIKAALGDLNQATQRELYWHDWHHTQMAIAATAVSPFGWAADNRAALERAHFYLFIRRAVNIGRGAEMVADWLEYKRPGPEKEPEWAANGGWHEGPPGPLAPAVVPHFQQVVGEMKASLPPVPPNAPFEKAMAEIIAEVRQAGAEPVYVMAPSLGKWENWSHIPDRAAFLSFIDPTQYPELYDPAVHYDEWHLNAKGAHLFTKLLAAKFAATLPATPTR